MSYSNYPSSTSANQPAEQPKDNRKLIYGILIAALVGTWGYIIYDKNKSGEKIDHAYDTVYCSRFITQCSRV